MILPALRPSGAVSHHFDVDEGNGKNAVTFSPSGKSWRWIKPHPLYARRPFRMTVARGPWKNNDHVFGFAA